MLQASCAGLAIWLSYAFLTVTIQLASQGASPLTRRRGLLPASYFSQSCALIWIT